MTCETSLAASNDSPDKRPANATKAGEAVADALRGSLEVIDDRDVDQAMAAATASISTMENPRGDDPGRPHRRRAFVRGCGLWEGNCVGMALLRMEVSLSFGPRRAASSYIRGSPAPRGSGNSVFLGGLDTSADASTPVSGSLRACAAALRAVVHGPMAS